jgi:hypothetical protein
VGLGNFINDTILGLHIIRHNGILVINVDLERLPGVGCWRKFDAQSDGVLIDGSEGFQDRKSLLDGETQNDELIRFVLAVGVTPREGAANTKADELLDVVSGGEGVPGQRLDLSGVGSVIQDFGRAIRPSDNRTR